MKTFFVLMSVVCVVACSNGSRETNVDSSNVITDSSALMNQDTTSVIGAAHLGEGQMRTDTPMSGSNVGK